MSTKPTEAFADELAYFIAERIDLPNKELPAFIAGIAMGFAQRAEMTKDEFLGVVLVGADTFWGAKVVDA